MGDRMRAWDFKLRKNAAYAVAWRLATELMRRHHTRAGLRVGTFYQGLSPHGGLYLTNGQVDGCMDGGQQGRLNLNLGGGEPLLAEVVKPCGKPRLKWKDTRWKHRNLGMALLEAEDPKTVVDDVEALFGLPHVSSTPPSKPAVLCARVIAEVLESRSLHRKLLRTSPGYLDHDGAVVACEWVRAVPEVWKLVKRARSSSRDSVIKEWRATGRLVLLHSDENPNPPDASGVVFDLATGRAWRTSRRRRIVALTDLYRQNGRRLDPLVQWVNKQLSK